MWLSENKRRTDSESTEAALGMFGESSIEVLSPAGILRIPPDGESCLMLNCTDGSRVCLGTMGLSSPAGLNPGEIYIKTANAELCIKNNGDIDIIGSVNITGSLSLNGQAVT